MTMFDNPNREAVGLEPIWAGAGGEVVPQEGYDPGDDVVADVQAYVEANPDQRAAVLKAEKAGKNRTTLVDWLQGS